MSRVNRRLPGLPLASPLSISGHCIRRCGRGGRPASAPPRLRARAVRASFRWCLGLSRCRGRCLRLGPCRCRGICPGPVLGLRPGLSRCRGRCLRLGPCRCRGICPGPVLGLRLGLSRCRGRCLRLGPCRCRGICPGPVLGLRPGLSRCRGRCLRLGPCRCRGICPRPVLGLRPALYPRQGPYPRAEGGSQRGPETAQEASKSSEKEVAAMGSSVAEAASMTSPSIRTVDVERMPVAGDLGRSVRARDRGERARHARPRRRRSLTHRGSPSGAEHAAYLWRGMSRRFVQFRPEIFSWLASRRSPGVRQAVPKTHTVPA
jgi:hypothetical protein